MTKEDFLIAFVLALIQGSGRCDFNYKIILKSAESAWEQIQVNKEIK